MKRLLFIMLAAGALAACNKPTEENCRKALSNMQRLMGTENVRDPELIEGEVRRCKGGSKKAAVDCAIKAQTFEELKHCNFYHLPDNALPANLRGSGVDTGSTGAAPMTGSAGSATTDTGSAGSAAMGSAATDTGSAGSAAMGSAAMGSGAGSAGSAANAGSAAKATPAKTGSAGSAAATK